jgi:hypothetical protein
VEKVARGTVKIRRLLNRSPSNSLHSWRQREVRKHSSEGLTLKVICCARERVVDRQLATENCQRR